MSSGCCQHSATSDAAVADALKAMLSTLATGLGGDWGWPDSPLSASEWVVSVLFVFHVFIVVAFLLSHCVKRQRPKSN